MGVDHRRADIPMTQQLLDSADVIAIFEEMCSKGMANLTENCGWGGGEVSGHIRLPEPIGDEVDDAVFGLQRPGDAEEGSVLARVA